MLNGLSIISIVSRVHKCDRWQREDRPRYEQMYSYSRNRL